jgi:putative transposase
VPRKSSLDAPGILHYVIVRGIERGPIVNDDCDKGDLFDRCGWIFAESNTVCYAWAFLSNHVHLLLRTGTVPMSKVMARLPERNRAVESRANKQQGQKTIVSFIGADYSLAP